MGIHNEPGHARISPIPPLPVLVGQLLEFIMNTSDPERSFLPFLNDGSDEVVLVVNNLGGLSELELGGIASLVVHQLSSKVKKIHRVLVGTFMVRPTRFPLFGLLTSHHGLLDELGYAWVFPHSPALTTVFRNKRTVYVRYP